MIFVGKRGTKHALSDLGKMPLGKNQTVTK